MLSFDEDYYIKDKALICKLILSNNMINKFQLENYESQIPSSSDKILLNYASIATYMLNNSKDNKFTYQNDNIETVLNEQVRELNMEKIINCFGGVNQVNTINKTEIENDNRYNNVTLTANNVNNNITNFNKQYNINQDQIEAYKKKLEDEMNSLFKENSKDEEDKESEIIYDN